MNQRISNLRKLLTKHSLNACLISSVPNIIYLTQFTHFNDFEREAFLVVTENNQYIFTDGRYTHAVKKYLKGFVLKEIGSKSFSELFQEVIREEKIRVIGIETHNLTVFEHQKISQSALGITFKHFDLTELRVRKDPDEIEKIKHACALGDKTFEYIQGKIATGMSEQEVAFEMELFMRKHGHNPSFDTIVAFEENTAIPHHKTGSKKLEQGNIILLDFGVRFDSYCSDMSRTIFFGKPTPEKERVYKTVFDAQEAAVQYIQNKLSKLNSVSAAKADEAARLHILGLGFETIPHALGHGIGLQVHEAPTLSPKSKDLLTEGMVFSIEPGIYLPDVFGVRIEDLFVISGNKLVRLTQASRQMIQV